MNEDDENIEPVTDLEPAPSYYNQYIQWLLSSGAGANAGSSLDMTFVATDPLSELVWSPRKGLSLKCADGSFSEKKSSFAWGAGPRNVISRSQTDKLVTLERHTKPMESFGGNGDDSFNEKLSKFVPSDAGHTLTAATDSKMEERKAAAGETLLQENKYLISNEKVAMHKNSNLTMSETPETSFQVHEPKLEMAQDDPSSSPTCGKPEINFTLGMEDVLASKGNIVKEGSSPNTKSQNATSSKRGHKESPSSAERCLERMVDSCPNSVYPMEKPESTAENDVRALLTENVCNLTTKAVASISACAIENSPQNDERRPNDNAFISELSPTNSGSHWYKMKGKEKALSGGNVSGKMRNDEDGSHGSAESCNSAGQFPTRKKRWNADQEFVVKSKRVKMHLQDDSPDSLLFAKKDSSFMNWISNMMKGFSKSNEDEAPSLALTLANPSHGPGRDSNDQAVIMSNRNREYGSRTMGFQSIFQSLYCPRINTQVNVSLKSNYHIEESIEPELGNKRCDLNATPIACRAMTGNLYKRFLQSNEKLKEPISSSGESLVALPRDTSDHAAASDDFKMSVSAERKTSCHLETDEEKDRASLGSSACKHKTSDDANMISELPSTGKPDPISGFLKSSWITRFSSKASGHLQISSCKYPGEAVDFASRDRMGLNSPRKLHLTSHDHKSSDSRDFPDTEIIQNCTTAIDSSFGFCTSKVHHEEKSLFKLNPKFPSPRLNNSEAMASIFAKRLDALKHIVSSDATDTAAHSLTCFFCGMKGHLLQDCPDVTDSELENLLRNLSSYNKAEDFPRFCIRCLGLNHWAVQCPIAPPRRPAVCSTSLVGERFPNRIQLDALNDVPKSSDGGESQFPGAVGPMLHDGSGSKITKDLNLNLEFGGMFSPERSRFDIKLFDKDIASDSKGSKFKEPQLTPLMNFLNRQTSYVPKGIFDSIKQLRLSRTDILKWMSTKSPLSHLDGFFLRLRLGKWEEELGGTGYYVACITGEKVESPPSKFKNPIPVNVGGIKCLVESQYVSNHEFLEDEIMAWWSALLKSGGKLPSEEDLRSKVRQKMMLEH